MERAISASDANQRFSDLLREVQEGETLVEHLLHYTKGQLPLSTLTVG